MPELVDMNLPLEGVFHNCAIVSIKGKYPGCARKTMNSIWGMGQMMYTKLIVVVDETVDVQDLVKVRDAVLNNVNASTDLFISEGPLDALDHSSNQALYGSRLGVDATNSSAGEEKSDVTNTYHILLIHKEKPWQGRTTLEEYMKCNPDKFTIAVDDDIQPNDLSTIMWKVFNNIDAKRDLVILEQKIGIDATKKWREEGLTRDWPNDIIMAEKIKHQVDERWDEYGID
jgi:4-hydroxy-3-polyprenylbenzoate decarboxylase